MNMYHKYSVTMKYFSADDQNQIKSPKDENSWVVLDNYNPVEGSYLMINK